MRILFLAHRIPYPPNKGDKIRSFNEIKFLARQHQIDVLCLSDRQADVQYANELKKYCRTVDVAVLPAYRSKLQALFGLFSNTPMSLPYFFSKHLQRLVNEKLHTQRYDLLFAFSSSMAQYIEHVQQIPRVMDFVDLDSEKWAQYAVYAKFPYTYLYRFESKRLRTYEKWIANTFQHSFFVSVKEVEDFQKYISSDAPVTSILNGVDTTFFCPNSETYDPQRLVFTGAMDYWANVQTMRYFVQAILPYIQRVLPTVKLYIVGSNPAKELKKLTQTHSNIIVTGYVDQIQPYVQQSAAVVAPMRIARGIQNKLLEAMAMGVPVVTSSLGLEGIPAIPGQDIFVEDQPEHFASRVIELITTPALRQKLSANARKVIETHCQWDKNLEKLQDILETLT